ncbi:MAG: calcium-binding protein [Burkholderiales bacterium]
MPARLSVATSEWLRGGLGADTVVGASTNDVLFGGGGKDLLVGGAGHDLINGDDDYEAGDLTTAYAEPAVGAGAPFNAYYAPVIVHDRSFDVGAADEIHAGAGDDAVYGEFGDDVVWGDDGADTISGGEDNDALYGGKGDDRIAGDDYGQRIGGTTVTPVGRDFIDGGAGNDLLYGDGGSDILLGGDGNDMLQGGNDLVTGGVALGEADDGDDYLAGGAGNDTLAGDAGSDSLYGDDGDDTLFGDSDFTSLGLQGDDHLEGGAGNDMLRGYGGADTLLAGSGSDTLYGEAGDDYLDVGANVGGVADINTAYGGDGDDTIVGYLGQQNNLVGEAGDDTITGEGHVWGQAGNDTLVVRGTYVDGPTQQQSVVQGGDGDDVIRLPNGGASAYGEAGNDVLEGGAGTSFMSGGSGEDVVAGGTGDDYAWGEAGVDALTGGDGNDQLAGGDGDDEVSGDAGDDVLFGNDGNDTLAGGPGRSYLDGGAGDDRYLIEGDEAAVTIVDRGGNNVVEFADGIVAEALSFGVGVDALGNDHHLVIGGVGHGGRVTIADGLGGAVSEYRFADGTTLTAADVAARARAAGALPRTPIVAAVRSLLGSAGADNIAFEAGPAAIDGGYGNDTLAGGAFADTLAGGAGDDRLAGGGGSNVLIGGDGRDTYVIGLQDGGTTINERRITGAPATEVDTLEFGAGITAAQTRLLRDGNNLVVALNGGPALVTVVGYYATSSPVAGGGTNYLDCQVERMQFADGTAWDSAQIATRIGQGTVNAMTGTAGDDTFVVDNALDTVTEAPNAGDDTVRSSVSYNLPANVEHLQLIGFLDANAWANAGNAISYLVGNDGNNVFDGPGGPNNAATGGGVNAYAVMAGGKGDDTYYLDYFRGGTVVENPGEGNDTVILTHGASAYVLPANVENAIDVNGAIGTGSVTAYSLTGNDLDNVLGYRGPASGHVPFYIDGGGGADTMQGSLDDDVYIVDNAMDRVVETGVLGGGVQSSRQDEIRASVSYTLPENVERLTLTGSDPIDGYGNGLANRMDGSANAAANRLVGGGGDDYYVVDGGDTVVERPGEGRDTVQFEGTGTREYTTADLPAEVEVIALGASTGSSNLSGNAANNGLLGNDDANVIAGGGGDDNLVGGGGDDMLSGDAGNDALAGGAGADTYRFAAGFGRDVLTDAAGANDNSLVFEASIARSDIYFDGGKLTVRGTNDAITLGSRTSTSLRADGTLAQENFRGTAQFADGTRIDAAELTTRIVASFSHAATAFADGLEGTAGDDALDGGAGTDVLDGMAGNDTLLGGDHGDWLFGGEGADRLTGGAGNDTLHGDAGDDVVAGDDGDDQLAGDAGNDRLEGGAGRDTLAGGVGDDVVDGGDDADVLHGDDGNDILRGGALGDTLYGDAGDDNVDGGQGGDALYGGAGNDVLHAGNGDSLFDHNTLWGGDGNDTLEGGDGSDDLLGEAGNDVLDGGGGSDLLFDDSGNNVLRGGDGMDRMQTMGGNDLLDGGAGDDVLDGGAGVDTYVLATGTGTDTFVESWATGELTIIAVDAALGPADIDVQRGRDESGDFITISANGGADVLMSRYVTLLPALEVHFADGSQWTSSDIADKLYLRQGTSGADSLVGGMWDDRLFGYAGNDTLSGLDGNDLLDGGPGADTMDGGTGNDTFFVDDAGDIVTEAVGKGTDHVQAALNYVLPANVEQLTLTGSAATGTGNALDNRLTGNAAGNLLDGKAGHDAMAGGAGNDTYVVDNAGDTVTESAGEGIDTVQSSVPFTLAAEVENLLLTGSSAINGTGNAAANQLTGNGAANTLTGGSGDDRLDGGAGGDVLKGGAGNDQYLVDSGSDVVTEVVGEGTDTVLATVTHTLAANVENLTLTGTAAINGTGNALANTLIGNAANNVLDGGAGSDTLKGGAGNDTYVVDATGDLVTELAAEGTDTVQTGITLTLAANVENLTLTGTAAINGTGNVLANTLTGNVANNILDGGAGSDVLKGGTGNDTYVVDSATDTVTELAAEGTDTVQTAVTLTLAANVENLTLTGTAAINGTGNALANALTGNAADNVLDGATGADAMSGGAGNDTYVVDNALDLVTEAAGGGYDAVNAAITYVLPANVEQLTLAGTAAINATGNAVDNWLRGNAANNMLTGLDGNDTLWADLGNDVVDGSNGNDLLQAGAGNDTMSDTVGNNLLDGGAGADGLTGGTGRDLLIGGIGADTLVTGGGADIIAFNKGDGADVVQASIGSDDTLSLGGGVAYANLTLRKSGLDLILDATGGDQITFRNWYQAGVNNKSVLNLQVVVDAMAAFNPAGTDPLLTHKVANFDFSSIVGQFDAALAATPTLTSWNVSNALASSLVSGSDSAAIGGDLAYDFGHRNALSGIGAAPAGAILASTGFGTSAQALQGAATLYAGTVRLN